MPFVLAFLSKDWKYLAVIVALAVTVGVIYHKGEEHVKAADAKAAAAQIVHNEEVEHVVETKVAAAVKDYESLAPIPEPAPVPVLVCRETRPGPVPARPSPATGSDGAADPVPVSAAPVGAGFDPAPAVSATGSAADEKIAELQAEVTFFQAYVKALQDAGIVAK